MRRKATKVEIDREIIVLLRKRMLLEDSHDICISKPLGSLGLGLDSLAMVHLISKIENHFEIQIPETVWPGLSQLTLANLSEIVFLENPGLPKTEVAHPTTLVRILNGVKNRIYREDVNHIIAFDLRRPVPDWPASIPLTLRKATKDDVRSVAGIWNSRERAAKIPLFLSRVASRGYEAYVAVHQERIVGIDWISSEGDFEPHLGVSVTLRESSSYGVDLNEHADFRGKGVGLALLCNSLRVAKAQGYRTQYALVRKSNRRMLRAAIQLVGAEKIGEIRTRVIAGRPFSTWSMGGKTGSRTLEL